MRELFDPDTFELETLLRQAGDYADVSHDLRPRILRAARRNERQTHLFKAAAVGVLILALLFLIGGPREDSQTAAASAAPVPELLERDWRSLTSANVLLVACALDGRDGSWGAVEVFCHIRERRRELFRYGQ